MLWIFLLFVVGISCLYALKSFLFRHFTVKSIQPVLIEEEPIDELADHEQWRQQKLSWHREGLREWQDDFDALLPDNEKADRAIANLLSVNEQRTLIAMQIPYIVSWGGSKVHV